MKKNILISLILLITATVVAEKAYGYAEAEQALQTSVQPTVTIEKQTASIENAVANGKTGTHSGLQSVFNIKTNGNDDNYDFIITSSILHDGGTVSAYGSNGSLLFVNTLSSPTSESIENARIGGDNNRNVIAYPVDISTTSPITADFKQNYSVYGNCYVIKVNSSDGADGTVTHIVGQTPVQGTYSVGQDQAGTYQATVTFTAYSK